MNSFLVVVDMQNDFCEGALGTNEARAIVPNVVNKINEFSGHIIATLDTHGQDYLETAEGKKLPVKHCIKDTHGWEINADVKSALDARGAEYVEKNTFGSVFLPTLIEEIMNADCAASGEGEVVCNGESCRFVPTADILEHPSITIIGLCTDICVVSNALLLKAFFPEGNIAVVESCCAGVTPELHEAAMQTMRSCHIDII